MASPRGVSSAASTAASTDSYQDVVVKSCPTKLFVGGLMLNTTTKVLRAHFSKYGRVMDCIAMRQPDGKARGFGYVTMDTLEAASLCVSEPQTIDGRIVDVKMAVPGRSKTKEAASAAPKKQAPVTVNKVCPKCSRCEKCTSPLGTCDADTEASDDSWVPPSSVKSGGRDESWKSAGAWSAGGTWQGGGWGAAGGWQSGGWRQTAPYYVGTGSTMNSSLWNGAWGHEEQEPVLPPGLEAAAVLRSLAQPSAPPPGLGLPQPRGMSLFRTPSSSECSSAASSRCSSPAREVFAI